MELLELMVHRAQAAPMVQQEPQAQQEPQGHLVQVEVVGLVAHRELLVVVVHRD